MMQFNHYKESFSIVAWMQIGKCCGGCCGCSWTNNSWDLNWPCSWRRNRRAASAQLLSGLGAPLD